MITFAFKGYSVRLDNRKTALFAGTAKIERVNQYYLGVEEYVCTGYSAKTAAGETLEKDHEIKLATWLYNDKYHNSEILHLLDKADAERARAA